MYTVRGYSISSVPQLYTLLTEDTVRIVNPFITNPITRNDYHIQLFLTPLHMYTAYDHKRSWLQSLITLLHTKSPYWLNASSLADFSANSHYRWLSHTVAHAESSIHAANSLLVELLLITDS
jgi:hypothetical protein